MRFCFAAPVVAALALLSAESAAQGLPPAPPAPPPSSAATNAAPAAPGAPTAPSATPPPGPEVAPPGPGTPPPPPGPDALPPGTGTAPPPPPMPGQTTIPQGSPTPQPYPYPYYPPPYYGQGYPPGWQPRAAPKMKTVWYGWQSLIGVVAGDLLTLTGGYSDTAALMFVGIGGHVLTGPIVHWAHGHVGKGFIALGFTAGIPAAGVGIGLLGAGTGIGIYGGLLLGGIGYFVGPILDMSLLSTEEVPDETVTVPKGARLLLPTNVGIMPMLDQNRRGLMLVGQF